MQTQRDDSKDAIAARLREAHKAHPFLPFVMHVLDVVGSSLIPAGALSRRTIARAH